MAFQVQNLTESKLKQKRIVLGQENNLQKTEKIPNQ